MLNAAAAVVTEVVVCKLSDACLFDGFSFKFIGLLQFSMVFCILKIRDSLWVVKIYLENVLKNQSC